jgi:N-hydroxyarylamine O-acetyltransferase
VYDDPSAGALDAWPTELVTAHRISSGPYNRGVPESIRPETAKQVLERLGLGEAPPPSLEGLNRLYRAWCRSVPFDNVRKRIALETNEPAPLPGAHAEDFLGAWLRHGTGGTCWPSSNGLFAVVRACGFDARRISASMWDQGEPNHGSVLVRIEGEDYVTDSFPAPP